MSILCKYFDKICNFSLAVEDPQVFALSQWQRSQTPLKTLAAFRLITFIWLLANIVECTITEVTIPLDFPNCTNAICALSGLLGAIIILKPSIWGNKKKKKSMRLIKIYYALYTIGMSSALFSTVLYWMVMVCYNEKICLTYCNFSGHCVLLLVMLLNFIVNADPVVLGCSYLPALWGLVYCYLTLAADSSGLLFRMACNYTYPFLNWVDHPWIAHASAIVMMILLVACHCVWYSLYLLKKMLYERLHRGTK